MSFIGELRSNSNAGERAGQAISRNVHEYAQWANQRAAQQEEQRHQQEMLDRAYAQQAELQAQEANYQRRQLKLAYKLEADRRLKAELCEKERIKVERQKMITEQREYEQKIEVLSYSVLGLSVLVIVLVLVVIFKRKKTLKVQNADTAN